MSNIKLIKKCIDILTKELTNNTIPTQTVKFSKNHYEWFELHKNQNIIKSLEIVFSERGFSIKAKLIEEKLEIVMLYLDKIKECFNLLNIESGLSILKGEIHLTYIETNNTKLETKENNNSKIELKDIASKEIKRSESESEYCCEEMKKLNEDVSGMDFKERSMLISNGYDETRLSNIKYCFLCGKQLHN